MSLAAEPIIVLPKDRRQTELEGLSGLRRQEQPQWKYISASYSRENHFPPPATPFGPLSLMETVGGRSSSQAEKTLDQRWKGPEGTEGSIE